MALKHAFVSSAPSTPDPNDIDAGKWNEGHVLDTDGLDFPAATTTPAAPTTPTVRLFGRNVAGRMMTAAIGSDGLASVLQPHLGRNKIAFWLPAGTTNAVTSLGIPPPNTAGTARSISTSNLFQSMRRIGFATAATANSVSNTRTSAAQFFLGSSPGMGGFHYICRLGTSNASAVTDGRAFVGLGINAGNYGATNPSSFTNILGIGYDGGDTNWSIFNNDGLGAATKTDLGANFPCTTQSADVYELVMYAAPGSSVVNWAVTRLNTGDFVAGVMSSDLPAANFLMQPHFQLASGASGNAVGVDLMSLYIETDS